MKNINNNKVILNLIQNLQRGLLSLRNDERGRSQIKFGMTPNFNNNGFTLIELLVVVLIIGILAAVALPQYQKAVLKTRMSSILAMMKTIKEAEERYYLANGVYVDDITQLDIDVPAGDVNGNLSGGHACYKNGTCFDNIIAHDASGWVIIGGIGSSSQDTTSDTCFFTLYFDHSTKPGVIECGKTRSRHPQCNKLCKSMGYE